MAGLAVGSLAGDLRAAAVLIDQKDYFRFFEEIDEEDYARLAEIARGVGLDLTRAHGDMSEVRARAGQSAAGALGSGMHGEAAEATQDIGFALADWAEMAPALEEIGHWATSRRAGFFKIVLIYWQQAQYFGCPNPGSLDAVLLSDTYDVLEEARRAWDGLAENTEA